MIDVKYHFHIFPQIRPVYGSFRLVYSRQFLYHMPYWSHWSHSLPYLHVWFIDMILVRYDESLNMTQPNWFKIIHCNLQCNNLSIQTSIHSTVQDVRPEERRCGPQLVSTSKLNDDHNSFTHLTVLPTTTVRQNSDLRQDSWNTLRVLNVTFHHHIHHIKSPDCNAL